MVRQGHASFEGEVGDRPVHQPRIDERVAQAEGERAAHGRLTGGHGTVNRDAVGYRHGPHVAGHSPASQGGVATCEGIER